MRDVRKYALAVSIVASLLCSNATFAAQRDGGCSAIDQIKARIKAFIVHFLDDSGLGIPPGSQ